MTTALFVVLTVFGAAWFWFRGGGREDFVKQRSADIASQADKLATAASIVYAGEHEYRVASDEDFAGLDREFYSDATSALEREGFVHVADVVDLTMRRAFPNLHSVGRIFLGDGGRTRAVAYTVRMLGTFRVFQLLGLVPRRIAVVEAVTEVDGTCRFISTANTHGIDKMSLPESVAVERLVPGTSPKVVLARHRERLSAMQREVFVVMRDTADVFASAQRSNLVVAHYRKNTGPLTEDELKALVGRQLRAHEVELVDAVTQRWATRG